jgi:uncharacterized protein
MRTAAEGGLCSPASGRGKGYPEIGWREALRFAKIAAMKSTAKSIIRPAPPSNIAARLEAIDWTQATGELDAQGCAVLNGLLSPDQCRALAALYPDDENFPQPGGDGTPRLRPRRV